MSDKKSGITALIIMDGFGVPVDTNRSAILEENTKNIQELAKKYPSTKIYASEEEVGLPNGQSGTSEVGHLTIGAGRIVFQPIVRVNKAIEDGSFYTNPVLVSAMENAKIEGRKEFVAVLKQKTEDSIVLYVDDENIKINMKDIAYITPYIDF